MSRRPLAPLLGLLALLAVGVFWLVQSVGREAATPAEQATALAATPASEAHEPPALTTALPDAPIETALATPAREEVAKGPAALGPDDVVWLEGRVRLPDGTPADEHVEVMALAADDYDWDNAQRSPLAPDGSFRVSVAKTAEQATLDLASRYVYLGQPLAIAVANRAKDPQPIVLSPKLGGCVRGRMILPPNALDRRASLVGTHIEAQAMSESPRMRNNESVHRSAKANDALEFELGGIPDKRRLWINAQPKGMVTASVEGTEIQVGRIVQVDLELLLGARASGRVVDEKGAPLAGVRIETYVERARSSWGGEGQEETDADGAFDISGIRPGRLTLETAKEGWTVTRVALGEVADGEVKSGLSLVLGRGLSISGRVLWPDGRGANDCKIDVQYTLFSGENKHHMRNEQRSSSTDADGAFEISGLGSELVAITASSGARAEEAPPEDAPEDAAENAEASAPAKAKVPAATAHLDDVKPGTTGLKLTLVPGKAVRGRAIDDVGQPVAKFRISAVPIDNTQPWDRERNAVKGSGDAPDGHFELLGLHEGAWDVTATAKDHAKSAPHRVVIPRDTDAFDLVLPRTATVAGVVTDPSGAPVEHATVHIMRPEQERVFDYRMNDPDVQTDKDGRFVLPNVPPGPQKISAAADGYADSELVAIEPVAGQSVTDLALALRRGGRIVGDVLDDEGHPRPGTTLNVQGMSTHSYQRSNADADGHFEIGSLAPGNYWISSQPSEKELAAATKPGEDQDAVAWARLQKTASVVVVEGETTHVVLGGASRDGIRIHGTITCSGKPAAGWMFWVMNEAGAGHSQQSGASDAQGRYEVSVDGPGKYSFSVHEWKGGISFSDHVEVPAGASFEHDIVLPAGRVSGRVLGPNGDPAPQMQVTLSPDARTAELSSSASYGHRETDEKGAFVFEGLKGGSYKIRVSENNWLDGTPKVGTYERSGIVLAEGGRVDGLEIRLASAARIEGMLVGPDGQAVAGATVSLRDEGGNRIEHWPATISDASGRFSVDGLAAGRVSINARTRTLTSAGNPSVSLRAGETTPVEMTLVPGTVLRVVVQEADGKVVGSSVRVEDDRGKEVGERFGFDDPTMFGSPPSETGQRIGPLPAGRYKVTATNHDKQSVSQDVSVSGAEQVVTLKYGG